MSKFFRSPFVIYLFSFLLVFAFVFFVAAMLVPVSAFAVDVDSGTPNSAAMTYLSDVVKGLPPTNDYFLYKSGDYTVTLLYGDDFSLSDSGVVSAQDATMVVYNTRDQQDGYNYTPSVTSQAVSGFQVSTNKYSIVYSNLGSFARLEGTERLTLSYLLYAVIFLIFVFIVFKLLRNRRHYINL